MCPKAKAYFILPKFEDLDIRPFNRLLDLDANGNQNLGENNEPVILMDNTFNLGWRNTLRYADIGKYF